MEAYHFKAFFSRRRGSDILHWAEELIVQGESREPIEACHRDYLDQVHFADDSEPKQLDQVQVTPVYDVLMGEAQDVPIDWPALRKRMSETLCVRDGDVSGAGYWVPLDELPAPEDLPPALESLPEGVEADLRSALNWDAATTYFFMVTAFKDPEALEADLTAIVEARNAVIARWLWHRHAECQHWPRRPVSIAEMPLAIAVAEFYAPVEAGDAE